MAAYGWKVRTSPRRTIQGPGRRRTAPGESSGPARPNYASTHIVKHDDLSKNLRYIPTLITDPGNEVVIFDEALVNKGSERWNLILCRQFVRYEMNIHELSAIASSVGKPMLMDTITATMCHKGMGNFEFARVLVEMDAKKEFKKEIVIQCRDRNNNVKGNKTVKVVYNWKPLACVHCKVFGHDVRQCKKGGTGNGGKDDLKVKSQGTRNNNFSQWKHNGNGRSRVPDIRRHEYRKRQVDAENLNKEGNGKDNDQEIRILKERMIIDKFLNQKMQPTLIESMTWSKDMIYYFKEKWEEDREKQRNKGIEVCAVLETRLKCKKLQKACDKVFQDWEWVSNMDVCNKGCIIVIGWDNETNVQVLHKTSQAIFCIISAQKYVNGKLWCIDGDMNVNLYPNEHSCGTSIMNSDMMEFQDCLNAIEVEDICSSAKLMEEFCEVESDEEKFLHQQAKIKWLCDGDKNIKFFHRVLKGRSNKSKVFSLCDDYGNSYDQEQIPQLFLKHFENFLGSTYLVQDIESSGTLFKKKLSFVAADKIIADISDAEIKRALFDIDDTKAHGPDGFTVAFFKHAWSIVVQILVMLLKSFLLQGKC
ncbi:RNA-directed DNA polymerase, eukaryota, reverse transcriptase zinc-binding domain protein [Tanacetum coccineum]